MGEERRGEERRGEERRGEEKLKKFEIFKHTWMNTGGCSLTAVEASNVTYPDTVQTVQMFNVQKYVFSKRWDRGGRENIQGVS
jgi:hypothetical protein